VDEVWELVRDEAIIGIGSKRRLRAVQLLVPEKEALGRRVYRNRLILAERGSSPLDRLARMCSDRKTTFRARIDVPDPRTGVRASWIWSHKAVT
jgi:hypothetical protein